MEPRKMFYLFVLLEVGLANGYTTAPTTKTPNVDKPGMFYLHFLGRFVCIVLFIIFGETHNCVIQQIFTTTNTN
jgi:hypothetical protein